MTNLLQHTKLEETTIEATKGTVAYDSTGTPVDLGNFVEFDSTKSNLVELVESIKEEISSGAVTGIDASEDWLGQHLAGQKGYTHRLANIWQMERNRNTDYLPKYHYRGIAAHRLSRFLNHEKKHYHSVKSVTLHNGKKVDILVKRQYLDLEGDPILYIQFAEEGDGANQEKAYEDAIEEIVEGLEFKGNIYEYAFSSGSQMRTLKGVFILKDYELPESYLNDFDPEIEGITEYLSYLEGLRGAEAILEVMTYGAYSQEFSNGYKEYLASNDLSSEVFEDVYESASKFMSRVGMAGTASESLGHNWRVKHMGEVRYEWTEELGQMFRDHQVTDYQGNVHNLYTEADIETIKNMWAYNKLDGQSIGRASTVCKALNKIGYNVTIDDITGALLQDRWAGKKGTTLIIADEILDACKDANGNYVYRDFDIIIEENSWKYSPSRFYTGNVGPELELVNVSKTRFSNHLNYQFLLALDGDNNNPDMAYDTLTGLVDKQLDGIREGMTDASAAEVMFGMTDVIDSPLEEIGIDPYEMTQRSKVTKALAVDGSVIHDRWFRRKLMDIFSKAEDECKLGKIQVEGANRYIISDPIGMLRTDLIKINPETGLEDIVIDHFDQVALQELTECYWAGKEQEAVLFRSPCIHPGEPQKVNLTNYVPETIKTGYGSIPVAEIYDSMKDIIVINGFSNILESMGGADTDGDTVLAVTDPDVVALKDNMRKALLVSADSGSKRVQITPKSIKENMVFSLKNNGIGLVTNYATTWRDIQLHVARKRSITPKIRKELLARKKEAQENADTMQPWVAEDTSIEALINMDVNDWKSVYKVCNATLRQLRILQEISINTAKSGVFIEFGSEDEEVNNYNHLALQLRASWHKPYAKAYQKYESGSIMADLNKYVVKEWTKLDEWAMETSSTLLPGVNANYGNEYVEIFDTVNSLRSQYGTQVYALGQEELEKEEFNEGFEIITDDIHDKLTILASKYGVDVVAVACYDASNQSSRSKKQADGTSFVWNCFFEEFLATLDFLNEDVITHRIHQVFLNSEFTYEKFSSGGDATIVDGAVLLEGVEIGSSALDDGEYEVIVINNVPYAKAIIMRTSVEELTVSLKGIRFPIVGFKNNDDKVAGEGKLTRGNVISYLTGPLNQSIIVTKAVRFGNDPNPSVGCYVRGTASTPMLIGVVPMEDKVLANALNDKAFKVSIPELAKAESDSRLTIEIVEVIKDYL